jgi:2-polyprenyl-3-methyl-5-hydroxy-6-metoxy-1,4-benzoquinol methylase
MQFMLRIQTGKSASMKNNDLISPITHSRNLKVTRRLRSSKIIELYKRDYNLDVSPYFDGLDYVRIIRCMDTGFRFYYPPNIKASGNFYNELQNIKGPDKYYAPWRYEHEFVFNILNLNDRVLDIGCGTGNFIAKASTRAGKVIGLEYNDLAINTCKERNLTVFDTSLKEFSDKPENKSSFDIICAFQVLEHVYDVDSFISYCLKLLHKGGKLIIGVPNNNPYLYKYDLYHTFNLPPHHMGLWNRISLINLQKFYPLKLEILTTEPNFYFDYWLDIQFRWLLGIKSASKILRKLKLYKTVSKLNKYIEGRNLLSIFVKI